jgi:hypothetical protein
VDWWLVARTLLPQQYHRGFDSIVLLVTWEIWKEGNRRTFESKSMTPVVLLRQIVDEANAWMGAGFEAMSIFLARTD